MITVQKEGKIRPRTGHEDPKRDQMYSSTRSLTSALDVGKWLIPRSGPFAPRKETQ